MSKENVNNQTNETNNINVEELNKGVDYMEQHNNSEVKEEPVMQNATENNPGISAQNVAPIASQPIINKEVAKEKVGELADKAKKGFNVYQEKLKNDKNVLYISIAVAIVVFALIVLFLVNVVFNPAKAVVKQYAKALIDMDAEKIVSLYHEDVINNGYYDEDDMIDLLESSFELFEDKDYYYKKYKIDNDYKKYDKEDVEELAEELEDTYDIDEKDVQAVRKYTVRFVVDDDGDKDEEKIKLIVAKINGKWYLINE